MLLTPFTDLSAAISAAFLPTLRDCYQKPSSLLRISQTFMVHVWNAFADPTDQNGRLVKQDLLPGAKGVVLDIGAGLGHSVQYFNRSQVSRYVALEPNVGMHDGLRQAASEAGYHESDGSLIIISCGAEDTLSILNSLGGSSVDTIVLILTLCSIPSAERVVTNLVRDTLKPGGELLFYEHVLSPRADVAWWQRLWTPIWSIFLDGCRLDCPSHLWIQNVKDVEADGKEVSIWSEGGTWGKQGEPEETLWWHQAGRFVKKT